MPRAIWSGAISFGLVSIPVKLYSSVSRKNVRFNQLDTRTGSRVKQKLVSAADGSEVDRSDIVRGYEITSGNWVTITDEELEAVDPKASRSIDIVEFVDGDSIDPIFFDTSYYLVPDELAAKAYVVLTEALEQSNKVALAKLVMRTKQHLATIRAGDGRLTLATMVYADEVNDFSAIDGVDNLADVDVRDGEIDMANSLIESMTADFEPEQFRDEYRDAVLAMIERKSSGENIVTEVAGEQVNTDVVDLMAALEASVAAAKESRKRHPSAKESTGDTKKSASTRKRSKKAS